jgi:Domain of unknown function (DUF4920)
VLRTMRTLTAVVLAAGLALGAASMAEPKKYGAGVEMTEATPIAAILAEPGRFEGKTVRVEGTVTAVCAHEGCWMALSADGTAEGPTLRLKVDDGVIVFPVTAKGHTAVAQGVFERVGGTPDSHEAAAEHAKQAPATLAEVSRTYQIKASGALVY